jgi:hypothetical protein
VVARFTLQFAFEGGGGEKGVQGGARGGGEEGERRRGENEKRWRIYKTRKVVRMNVQK